MNVSFKYLFRFFSEKILTLGLVNLISFVINIITISIILKLLGPSQWGKFILIQLWPNYLSMISQWSFNQNEVREISANRNDLSKINKIFSESAAIQSIISIFSIIIVFFLTTLNFIEVNIYGLFGLVLIIMGNANQFYWLINGLEKIWQVACFQLLSKFLILLLIVFISKDNLNYNKLLLIYGFGILISTVISYLYIFNFLKIKLQKIKLSETYKRFIHGFLYFFGSLSGNLKNLSLPIMINQIGGEYYVGLFSALERLKGYIIQISQPITNALYPRIVFLYKENSDAAREMKIFFYILSILITLPIVIFINLFPEDILLKFAGNEFTHLISELRVISFLSLIAITSEFFYYQNIIAKNLRKKLLMYNLFGLIILIVSNIFFINQYLVLGAIISLYVLELFNFLILFYMKEKN